MFHGHLDYLQKSPLGGRPNTKLGDHSTPNAHNCWFILFFHVWGPAWIEIHWNSIWLKAWSHVTSHYTWRSVTTLHAFGGVLGWPSDTFFWALTNSWTRLLARLWSGPKVANSLVKQFSVFAVLGMIKAWVHFWHIERVKWALYVPSCTLSKWMCNSLSVIRSQSSMQWEIKA